MIVKEKIKFVRIRHIVIFIFVFSFSCLVSAQSDSSNSNFPKNFPKSLDSFYVQVNFINKEVRTYEARKTKNGWYVYDTASINEWMFDDIETMLMFVVHVQGVRAKNYLIIPMFPKDFDDKIINQNLHKD